MLNADVGVCCYVCVCDLTRLLCIELAGSKETKKYGECVSIFVCVYVCTCVREGEKVRECEGERGARQRKQK